MFLQAQSKKSVVALSEVSQIQSKSSPEVEEQSQDLKKTVKQASVQSYRFQKPTGPQDIRILAVKSKRASREHLGRMQMKVF